MDDKKESRVLMPESNAVETKVCLDKHYSESALGKSIVDKWFPTIKRGEMSAEDDTGSRRPKQAVTDKNIKKAHKIILNDRKVRLIEIADTLKTLSKERVGHIVNEYLVKKPKRHTGDYTDYLELTLSVYLDNDLLTERVYPRAYPFRVVVGDEEGMLQAFSVKRGEIQTVFKTRSHGKISTVELGGETGNAREEIFVSSESEIKGFTAKGKQFFNFDTNLTEPIKSMYVEGNNFLVCGRHSFYHYRDAKEVNYFLCGDTIADVIALNSMKTKRLTPILACADRTLKVLDVSAVVHSVEIDTSPTVLHLFDNDGGVNGDQVLYGTSNGNVGLLRVSRNDIKNEWLIQSNNEKDAVTCIDCYDITGNNVNDIIIGRADGLVEVYAFNNVNEPPKKVYSYGCNESVTGVQGGIVGANGFHEIVVVTFSGWVFGLTTGAAGKSLGVTQDLGYSSVIQENGQKIQRLRDEVAELEERVARERVRYQSVVQESETSISAVPVVAIHEKFYLNKEDASYNLVMEVQTSIDNVLIQSDTPVDLLDIEKNSAVVSFSDSNPEEGNFLLATYRCQLNTTRLDLKIRTIEGQCGTLSVYITPNIQPKSCQLQSYRIKPLSLHVRSHNFDATRPYNTLKLKGGFSLAEMHSWIEFCLPEVPEKPPLADSVVLVFVSSFTGTMLRCTYAKGEAQFESDSISTISILKDIISKDATKGNKNRNLEILWDVNESSVTHVLGLLRPKLEHHLDLVRKISILQAVTELDLSNNLSENRASLTDEYLDIINNEKALIEEYKQQPSYLDRLYGIITDLYLDTHKFQGVNVKNKVPALLELLENEKYSFEKLVEFFQQTLVKEVEK